MNEPAKSTENTEDAEVDEAAAAEVRVGGATAGQASTVNGAAMSLIVGTGMLADNQQVLVPFVECEIGGNFGGDTAEKTLTLLLTFENVAFLAADFSEALAGILPALQSVAQGDLKPVPARIEYAIDCLNRTQANLARVIEGCARLT